MIVKVSYPIEIDETKYPNLTKSEIKKLVKEMEVGGGCQEYITEMANNSLVSENYDKSKR